MILNSFEGYAGMIIALEQTMLLMLIAKSVNNFKQDGVSTGIHFNANVKNSNLS